MRRQKTKTMSHPVRLFGLNVGLCLHEEVDILELEIALDPTNGES